MHTPICITTFMFLEILGAQASDTNTTFVGYFYPNWDDSFFYGGWTSTAASVAGVNAEATTYHVGCVRGAPIMDCDYVTSWTIIQGPETVNFNGKYIATAWGKTNSDITIAKTYDCSLQSMTGSATCTMSLSLGGSVDGEKTSSSSSRVATYTTAPITKYNQLTVTGGVESLTTPKVTKSPDVAAARPAGALITAAPVVAAAMAAFF